MPAVIRLLVSLRAVLLFASVVLALAQDRTADENDRNWNGFIVDGWNRHTSHYWINEGISSAVFALASQNLESGFRTTTG